MPSAEHVRNQPVWWLFDYAQANRRLVFGAAAALIVFIGYIDWQVIPNIGIGLLYFFPMLMIGACTAHRFPLIPVSVLCAALRELFSPYPWNSDGLSRLVFFAFTQFAVGLLVFELSRNRRLTISHLAEVEKQNALRREAEEQLRILIESSPAAIFNLDAKGRILQANEAAHRLLGCHAERIEGRNIESFLPSLAHVPQSRGGAPHFRTAMECRGQRVNGEVFLASVWFSTYETFSGARMAAIVTDVSESLRDREEFNLTRLMTSSRILVSAVSHEIRNFCGAIGIAYSNLVRRHELESDRDLQALGPLVDGLSKIASTELRQASEDTAASLDFDSLMDEVRIVVEPSLREDEIESHWDVAPHLPAVWADRESVFQVFLNLTRNSQRAMQRSARRELFISAKQLGNRVVIHFRDTGPGIADPERLFQPFQRGAEASGLGLYISRALMRRWRGDLRFEPVATGCSFAVEFAMADAVEQDFEGISASEPDSHIAARRPQTVSRKLKQAARNGDRFQGIRLRHRR